MFQGAFDANGQTRRSREGTLVARGAVVVVVGAVVVVDVVVVLVVVLTAVRHRFALQFVDVAIAPEFTEAASTTVEPDPDFELALGTLQAEASTATPETMRANRSAFHQPAKCDRDIRSCDITRAIGATSNPA
jgi:hypothetical protein